MKININYKMNIMKQEQTINKYDDEIDIKELFIILFKNKWLVLSLR